MDQDWIGVSIPTFTMWGPPHCGYDCERVLAVAAGVDGEWPRPFMPLPTTPRLLCERLRTRNLTPHQEDVPLCDLKEFLSKKLRASTPVAIWVRGRKNDFFYTHVIVVVGCDMVEGTYYVVNPRKGFLSTRDMQLPTGNKAYWKNFLFAIARNFPWSKTIPVVYL